MDIKELREELITYIHLADEKKLQALQTLLLDDKEEVEYKWWEDEAFVAELKERSRRLETGEDKGDTMEEVEAYLEKRKTERYAAQLQD